VTYEKSLPWWVNATVIAGALLLGAGGIIALVRPEMLVSPHAEMNSAARVYAGYLVSRNLALAIMLFAAWVNGARQALSGLMALAALVQFLDMGLDAAEGRIALVPGVIALGVVFSLAAARICGRLFWKETLDPSIKRSSSRGVN
jgi:hypothetical protein